MNTPSLPRGLIVDDDVLYARMLQRGLARRGLRTAIAHDADTALSLARGEAPDFALLDLKLGADSGLSLIEPLRALDPRMRILLVTGYASVATAVESIKRGADDYLPKPASVAMILRALGLEADTALGDDAQAAPERMIPLQRLEWEHIQQALQETGGNISATARLLGMHRRSLQRKLGKRPGPERKPDPE
ncbi:response regulator transcription factor [Marilutibacter maris]|uniref:Putative transcriptional regulator ycf27 n=1 Tax=Marilutibacter maris TaxID=1605891 RepID=A0A2U9T8H8_9GAMM|nr:response regulator transcription factor [Lysobacter maris]AWV07675.1 putative transcriptional regulator ycf27 [Lysobacter maris]